MKKTPFVSLGLILFFLCPLFSTHSAVGATYQVNIAINDVIVWKYRQNNSVGDWGDWRYIKFNITYLSDVPSSDPVETKICADKWLRVPLQLLDGPCNETNSSITSFGNDMLLNVVEAISYMRGIFINGEKIGTFSDALETYFTGIYSGLGAITHEITATSIADGYGISYFLNLTYSDTELVSYNDYVFSTTGILLNEVQVGYSNGTFAAKSERLVDPTLSTFSGKDQDIAHPGGVDQSGSNTTPAEEEKDGDTDTEENIFLISSYPLTVFAVAIILSLVWRVRTIKLYLKTRINSL